MLNRLYLQQELEKLVEHVYYNPPPNIQMNYPCIVYSKSKLSTVKANDQIYKAWQAYNVTYISKDSDSSIPYDILKHFPYAAYGNELRIDNLYQTTITIYI